MRIIFLLALPFSTLGFSQNTTMPGEIIPDSSLSSRLTGVVHSLGLDSTFDVGEDGTEQISLALNFWKSPVK